MKKKLLAIFLTICMAVALIPNVFAEDTLTDTNEELSAEEITSQKVNDLLKQMNLLYEAEKYEAAGMILEALARPQVQEGVTEAEKAVLEEEVAAALADRAENGLDLSELLARETFADYFSEDDEEITDLKLLNGEVSFTADELNMTMNVLFSEQQIDTFVDKLIAVNKNNAEQTDGNNSGENTDDAENTVKIENTLTNDGAESDSEKGIAGDLNKEDDVENEGNTVSDGNAGSNEDTGSAGSTGAEGGSDTAGSNESDESTGGPTGSEVGDIGSSSSGSTKGENDSDIESGQSTDGNTSPGENPDSSADGSTGSEEYAGVEETECFGSIADIDLTGDKEAVIEEVNASTLQDLFDLLNERHSAGAAIADTNNNAPDFSEAEVYSGVTNMLAALTLETASEDTKEPNSLKGSLMMSASPMAIADDGLMTIDEGYTMYPQKYDGDKYVYWDVAVPTGSGFPTHKRYDIDGDGDGKADTNKRVKAVYFVTDEETNKKVAVAKGDSSREDNWEIEDTPERLSNYYKGTTWGSKLDTRRLIIVPGQGYYVSRVIVGCTAKQPFPGTAYVVKSNPYGCGTWKAGNEYNESLDYEKSGEVSIDIPSLAFCHLSNGLVDNAYFILIEVEPLPTPLYVEYNYGDIDEIITDSEAESIFTSSSKKWLVADNKNGPSESYDIQTEYTQFKYYHNITGETEEQKDQMAAQAAQWTHYTNSISMEAHIAAASAHYVFDGWKAEYYTECNLEEPGSGTNNYTYKFDKEVGDAIYPAGEKVELRSHVKLTAQWKPMGNTNTVTVKKNVDGETDESEFSFEATLWENGSQIAFEDYIGDYIILSNDKRKAAFSLAEDGSAVFRNLPVGAVLKIEETNTKGADSTTNDSNPSADGKTAIYQIEQGTENKVITFTNHYAPKTGDLKIKKDGIQTVDHHNFINDFKLEENQSTIYRVQGNGIDMKVVIVGNSSTTVKNLPVGKYTVTEIEEWSWRYDATGAIKSATVSGGRTAETSFSNSRERGFWLSGDSWCRNWWGEENGVAIKASGNVTAKKADEQTN